MRVFGFWDLLRYFFLPLKKKPIRIFLLRGGLGNQLFQMAGMAYFSSSRDFDVIFWEKDVRLNPRDRFIGNCLDMDVFEWFGKNVNIYRSGKFLNLVIRVLRNDKNLFKLIKEIQAINMNEIDFYRVAFVSGYMQESFYVDSIAKEKLFIPFQIQHNLPANKVAIHIRAKDGLKQDGMFLSVDYYREAITALGIKSNWKIDVYSDDSQYAREMCSKITGYQFYFPEDENQFMPSEIISLLARYEYLIGSKSTLCWWASYLAVNGSKSKVVVSPWGDPLQIKGSINIEV